MNSKITILTDGSHRSVQANSLAKYLDDYNGAKQIVISCGIDVVDKAIELKNSNTFLVSILDPTKHHEQFDLIVVPEHDPLPKGNVVTTKGLLNHITPELLAQNTRDFNLPKPVIAVLVGGRHIGGNVSQSDAVKLINYAESKAASLLITTSKRTEDKTLEAIKSAVTKPHFIWDYNHEGQAANPYLSMLCAADEIVVTADSVRMCSEVASSGKPFEIFEPEQLHFSYKKLAASLNDVSNLNEAKRVSKIIKQLV